MSKSIYVHRAHNVSNLLYHFVSTVGRTTTEEVVAKYVREQGKEECGKYQQLMFDSEGIR
jgi:hypothetical protein